MNQPELMTLHSANDEEVYTALVQVTPEAVVFNLGFTFKFDRESVREVAERLLVLLGPCSYCLAGPMPHMHFSDCKRPRPEHDR